MISLYDVLKANKGLPVGEPIACHWGRKLGGGAAGYDELTGIPPLTFVANGRNLINYRIYGANDGVGEQTENLWKYTSSMRDITQWNRSQSTNYFIYYQLSSAQVNALNNVGNISLRMFLKDGGVHKAGLTVAITNSNAVPGTSTRLVKTDGTIVSQTFNAERWSNAYLVLGNTNTVADDLADENVQSLFDNYDIAIVSGSTAPTQYIPYGYQINAEVGDGVTTTDIPIYIGDTPLAQGEYVDYGEQKVYKYVDNVLTPTDPPVALPALPTIDGATIVDFDNTPKPSEVYIKYPK